jgi:hypothetical protein
MDLTEERPTITIRLKPALQDYIRYVMKLEGNVHDTPLLVATSRSYLGRLVAPFIELRPMEAKPILPGVDRELFTFRIVNYRSLETRRNTAWISERNQINIQNIIEAHFRLHFRVFADDKVRYLREQHTAKGSIKKVVLQFCADMNINYDDVTFDMISKAYYRGRKKSLKCGIAANKQMMIGHLFFII